MKHSPATTDQAIDMSTGFDATYHRRHQLRNNKKVKAILRHTSKAASVLDIGCNAGYLSAAMLSRRGVERVEGIELSGSVVAPALLEHPSFTLFEGNVLDYPFERTFSIVLYPAVHHHVFARYGRAAAMDVWKKLVGHCEHSVIFETGQLAERGEWYWKEALHRYYCDDATHFRDLLKMVGPRLRDVRVIARLWIHGTYRYLLKIDLGPLRYGEDPTDQGSAAYKRMSQVSSQWRMVERLRRTVGSRRQRLISSSDESEMTNSYDGTEFYILEHPSTGDRAFGKKVVDDPYKQLREFLVLDQTRHRRIIELLEISERYGLVFPYLDWQPLDTVDAAGLTNRADFAEQVRAFFQEAHRIPIRFGRFDLDPRSQERARPLIDVVDMHIHNLLVNVQERRVCDWVFVDMEYHANHVRARNEQHLTRILRHLDVEGQGRVYKKVCRWRGYAVAEWRRIAQRLTHRYVM